MDECILQYDEDKNQRVGHRSDAIRFRSFSGHGNNVYFGSFFSSSWSSDSIMAGKELTCF